LLVLAVTVSLVLLPLSEGDATPVAMLYIAAG